MITKFEEFIKENSEFNQYLMGGETQNSLGPGYGFATDPGLSIYSNDNNPYQDLYARKAGTTNKLMQIARDAGKNLFNDPRFTRKNDKFVEDSEYYKKLKILRMYENKNLKLDIFVSFEFNEQEIFGVFRNFNGLTKPPALSAPELFENGQYPYIDKEYILKLNNFLYKKLYNWFKPEPGLYINLKENNVIKDEMGRQLFLNKGKIVEIMGYNEDENNDPFAILKMKDQTYYIEKNNFYWINWRFDPANKKEESMKQIFGFNQFIIENRRWKKEYLTNLQDILSHKIDHAEEILSLSDLDPEGAIILLRELDTDYSNELADEIDKLLNMWGEFDVESEIELSKLN